MSEIKTADIILIGASNGLAIWGAYNIFAEDSYFIEYFGEFRKKYGFRSLLEGSFYPYPSVEEEWVFYSRMYAYFLNNKKASPVIKNLYEMVKEKNYFVITSNTDSYFTDVGFQKERLFEIEGNSRYLQCSQGCHDQIYPGDDILSEMFQKQENSLIELGVGARNQLIKAPFMNIASLEEKSTYSTLNKGRELYIPEEIANKSIGIDGDIAEMLQHLVQLKQA